MANIKVLLYDQAGTEYNVSYIKEIAIAITKAIADVRNPANRNADFSKTINFPSTKEIEVFFSLIWRLNNDLSSFDPRLKCRIKYYVNERIQLDGDLQLLKVNVDPLSNERIYECSATGTLGNLFIAIGDGYLTDLDFSAYNHSLTKANVKNSWVPATSVTGAIGSGYYHGHVNYGQNQVNSETEYHVKHFRPALYKREYWAKIFAAAGKTWTSTYLDSSYYKKLMIPFSGEYLKLSSTDVATSQFLAGRASTIQTINNAFAYSTFASSWIANFMPNTTLATTCDVLFNDDSTAPYNDAGGQYGTGTGWFSPSTSNVFNVTATVNYDLAINAPAGTVTTQISTGQIGVALMQYNGTNWFYTGVATDVFISSTPLTGHSLTVSFPNTSLVAGSTYKVVAFPSQFNVIFLDGASVPITTGTASLDIKVKIGSIFYALLENNEIIEGSTVEVNQAIPTEVKKIDWITTEIKRANLYILQDPLDENNYIIEPRDEGFYTGEDDWSKLLDFSKKYEVLPMSELDAKRYEFGHKSDGDEFNQKYEKTHKQTFGFGYTDCVSEFVKPTKKTELIYAATPMVDNNINGLVVPKIYKNDNGIIKPFKSVIRSLYNGGLINLSFGSWTLKSSSGDEVLTTYAFLGDCDNPYNPTLTLNWETPKTLFYRYVLATYTDNNLKNRFYSRMINQLSDKRSSVVKAYFNLDELKIKEFSFRKVVWVQHFNAWFYINTIDSYNVMDRESTLVTMLKLQDYDAFTPNHGIDVPDPDPAFVDRIVNGNYTNGDSNVNNGNASHIVGGNNNYIASGATNIQLRNCNNVTVNSDVTNFIGEGLSYRNITSSQNNTISILNQAPIVVTTDLSLDASYNNRILMVDATAANITLTWDCANMAGCLVYIIRTDASANTVSINDVDAIVDYIGTAVPVDLAMAQYDPRRITSNVTTIYNF